MPRRTALSWSGSPRKSITRPGSSPSRSPATIDSWRTQSPMTTASISRPSTPKARLARAGRPGLSFSNRRHLFEPVIAAVDDFRVAEVVPAVGDAVAVAVDLEVLERFRPSRDLGGLAERRALGVEGRGMEQQDEEHRGGGSGDLHGLAPSLASFWAFPVMGTKRVGLSTWSTSLPSFLIIKMDPLVELAPQGDHDPPAFLQLLDQRRRDLGRGAGDDDRVERRRLGPAGVAVADPGVDVVVPQFLDGPWPPARPGAAWISTE